MFEWKEEQQQAFAQLKKELVSTRVLAHFDPRLETIVTTDASAVAIGAVLSQLQEDGEERPVAYASRSLAQAERAYSVSEREALACIWACERWHYYLYGRKFTLRTDHSALTTLLAGGQKGRRPMRLLRWADRLYEYDFKVQYKPGCENVVADLLSRSDPGVSTDETEEPTSLNIATIFGGTAMEALSLREVAEASQQDDELSAVAVKCTTGWMHSDWLDKYYKLRDELSVEDGVVFRGNNAVIPASLRHRVLQLAHEGHPGIVKMRQRLRDTVWWPGINADVDSYVKHCEACLLSNKSARPVVAPLHSIPLPPKPWHTVALDIKGELHGDASRWRFLIVAYDLYSKWPEVRAVNTVTSSSVIAFLKDLFSRWGLPQRIITDNGKQFVSKQLEDFLRSLGVSHSRTALYHPQANGAVERFNRYLTDQLRIARVENRNVEETLFTALSAYRSTRHSTTQRSPAELMCGRSMTMPLDRLLKVAKTKNVSFDGEVASNVRRSQQRNEHHYNARNRAATFKAKAGDRVNVRENVRSNKYEPLWTLPKRIEKRLGDSTVRLEDGTVRNARDLVAAAISSPSWDSSVNARRAPSPPPAAEQPLPIAPHPAQPERRYPARERHRPIRLDDYDLRLIEGEGKCSVCYLVPLARTIHPNIALPEHCLATV